MIFLQTKVIKLKCLIFLVSSFLRGPNEGDDTSQETVRKEKLKDVLKNLLPEHNSKRDMSRYTLERQLSKTVNEADKNKDNEISLPEFLELMKGK